MLIPLRLNWVSSAIFKTVKHVSLALRVPEKAHQLYQEQQRLDLGLKMLTFEP